MNERSQDIFRQIIDSYMETGDPIGSRTLQKRGKLDLSPASIRNVMSDLEDLGLLYAPHTSAGRLPTELGMRLFVDSIMEVDHLAEGDRYDIDAHCAAMGKSPADLMGEVSKLLSGLSSCAGLALTPKADAPLKHIEFIDISPGRALVVLVSENGSVENRLVDVPANLPRSAMVQAGNYLVDKMQGLTLHQAQKQLAVELERDKAQLDSAAAQLIEAGLATWAGGEEEATLIVHGQANLLNDIKALEEVEQVQALLQNLEAKEEMSRLLGVVDEAKGVQVFIGAENKLFDMSGCSMVLAPYSDSTKQVVGVVGVIGPTRLNYGRIVPVVDYTAKVMGRLLS